MLKLDFVTRSAKILSAFIGDEIPQEILDFYKMYRPSPLVRAYCLEKQLDTPAKITVHGNINVAFGATLGAVISGDGTLEVLAGANTSGTFKDDLTPALSGLSAQLGALAGRGGVYCNTTLSAKFNDGTEIAAGKTYTCTGGVWA